MKMISKSNFEALVRWEEDGGRAVDPDEYVVVRDSAAEMHLDPGSADQSTYIEPVTKQLLTGAKKREECL
jgi:sensor c-di-GMP phosphodiesterase-like protein